MVSIEIPTNTQALNANSGAMESDFFGLQSIKTLSLGSLGFSRLTFAMYCVEKTRKDLAAFLSSLSLLLGRFATGIGELSWGERVWGVGLCVCCPQTSYVEQATKTHNRLSEQ